MTTGRINQVAILRDRPDPEEESGRSYERRCRSIVVGIDLQDFFATLCLGHPRVSVRGSCPSDDSCIEAHRPFLRLEPAIRKRVDDPETILVVLHINRPRSSSGRRQYSRRPRNRASESNDRSPEKPIIERDWQEARD